MLDTASVTLLASAVNKVTEARNRAERSGDVVTVDLLNLALLSLSAVEARGQAPVTYRVRHG